MIAVFAKKFQPPSKEDQRELAAVMKCRNELRELVLQSVPFLFCHDDATGEDMYEDVGPASRYRTLADQHFKDLEKELGNENPTALFGATLVVPGPKKA
jgi:hypothetical protein